jgi:hypothetical protein
MVDDGEDERAQRPVTEQDMLAAGLSREERRLVNIFRQLSAAKQRAILMLLKVTLRRPQDELPVYDWRKVERHG